MRVQRPENLAVGGVDRAHDRSRRADVDNPVHDDRFGRKPHRVIHLRNPGESQMRDVLVVDLLQRAELLLGKAPALDQPVVARCFGGDPRLRDIPG
jgi:hypothetical protein